MHSLGRQALAVLVRLTGPLLQIYLTAKGQRGQGIQILTLPQHRINCFGYTVTASLPYLVGVTLCCVLEASGDPAAG